MSTIGGIGAFASETASGMTGPAPGMLGEREVVRNTGKQAIVSFLESQTCYSVLRSSGKVVVFDTRIPIQLAFYALVEHGERNALIMLRNIIGRMDFLCFARLSSGCANRAVRSYWGQGGIGRWRGCKNQGFHFIYEAEFVYRSVG
jgi:hypothetical protein